MPAIYRRLPQLTRGDALANAISILEVLQATSSVIANAPFVGSIVGAALGLAKTVERVNGTRERYVRLARRAAELARHIEESIKSDPYLIDHNLQIQLVALHDLLIRIQRDVEKHLRRRPLSRLLYQSSMAATLDDYVDALDSAWRTFDTACLFALRMKMERQAIYDDQSQLRLFRWSDLRCLKVRGKYRVSCYDVGEEWEGKWDGRTVIVRTIRQSRPSEGCDYTSLVKYHPNLHHPYVAQVIGYSHPSLAERFYVMDAGVSPLMNQFRGKDIFSRLVMWLQHVVDYQDAFHYMEECGFPVSDCHSHDRCLPSAMLNEEGKLIIDASDFYNSNLGCFQSRLRTLCDEEHGALSPGKDYAYDDDVAQLACSLLALLRSRIGTTGKPIDVRPFIESDLAKLWASHQFQSEVNAKWGDYGYMERKHGSETFVRLGHIYDLVKPTGKLSTFILRRRSGCDWKPAEDYPWPEDAVCHVFERASQEVDLEDYVEEIAVVRTLPDDSEYHAFFWNHAEDIAKRYDIALHDIVLFEEVFHYAGAVFDDGGEHDESHIGPDGEEIVQEREEDTLSKLYFHQRTLLPSGEAPSPWGYWSLEPDFVPGPWPSLSIPGVELTCRVRSNYARVSTFEAEVLVYMNRLRRSHELFEDHNTSRIEEVQA